MSNHISPKTVIVTGASSGIGLAVAKAFLERGDNVVLNGRNESKLLAAAESLGRSDRTAIVKGDVGDPSVARQLVEAAKARFGGLDVLINNAGHFDSKPVTEYSENDIDGYLNSLRGAFFATQSAVPALRTRGGGAIINITTILTRHGFRSVPSSGPMTGKGGIEAQVGALASELASDNIRVNAVSPGSIRTRLWGATDEQFDEMGKGIPLGRFGEPEDIAQAVLYLANAPWVTGVILPVDGGASVVGT